MDANDDKKNQYIYAILNILEKLIIYGLVASEDYPGLLVPCIKMSMTTEIVPEAAIDKEVT